MSRLLPLSVRAAMVVSFIAIGAASAQITPQYTQVYASDSMRLWAPALSPDGRWIAFAGVVPGSETQLIYVIPSNGGTPVAVTQGKGIDGMPLWFPKGDAILFHSSRVRGNLMTIRIDPRTGHAAGVPERVTAEQVDVQSFAISPNGQEIAIGVRTPKGTMPIKIVPATGGTSRTVAEIPQPAPQILWREAGTLELSTPNPATQQLSVMRVSTKGGEPQLVRQIDQASGFSVLGPDYILRGARIRVNADTLGTVSVTTRSGDTVARFDTKGSWSGGAGGGFINRIRTTTNPDVVLMATSHPPTVARYATIDGGGSPKDLRKVADTAYADLPVGFTPDSKSVYLQESHRGKIELRIVPLSGGGSASRVIPIGSGMQEIFPTTDGRYAYVLTGHGRDSERLLRLLDFKSGTMTKISDHLRFYYLKVPRGSDDALFMETSGPQAVLRHFAPGAPLATIASVDTLHTRLPLFQSEYYFVGGIAFTRSNDDTTSLYVQRGNTPRLLATVRGTIPYFALSPDSRALFYTIAVKEGSTTHRSGQLLALDDNLQAVGAAREVLKDPVDFDGAAWSPDGQTLVVGTMTRVRSDTSVTIQFLSRAGTITRAVELPRTVGFRESAFVWSKDNTRVFVLMSDPIGLHMDVWRVGSAPNDRPVSFASRDQNTIWDFVLSPDEKTVAYSAELPSHYAIWKVTLPGLSAARAP
jgi:Tol biopolymer transport system component